MLEQLSSQGFLNPDVVVGQFGVTEGMRIADFGCGTGHIGILVAQKIGKDGKLTALDIMEDKLDSISSRAKAAGLENLETVRANLEVLGSSGLADGSQDVVMLINILFQSNKKGAILAEAKRVLNPGGKLILADWKKGVAGLGPPDELRTSETEIQSLLKEVGFGTGRSFDAGQFHYGLIFTNS